MLKRNIAITVVLAIIVFIGLLVFHRNQAAAPQSKKTAQKSAPSFDTSQHSTSDAASLWVVVNKSHPLQPVTYAPSDLTAVGNGQQLRAEAATALQQLIAGAAAQKLTIKPLSGYRSYATQQSVYANEVRTYGQAKADTESAKPGYSEHQTGWAIDVGGGGCGIEDCFGNTAEGKWLAANAYQYGFIIRYTAENQSVTGYRAEPWHIRYVGTGLSNELHRTNTTTLEQFFGL